MIVSVNMLCGSFQDLQVCTLIFKFKYKDLSIQEEKMQLTLLSFTHCPLSYFHLLSKDDEYLS